MNNSTKALFNRAAIGEIEEPAEQAKPTSGAPLRFLANARRVAFAPVAVANAQSRLRRELTDAQKRAIWAKGGFSRGSGTHNVAMPGDPNVDFRFGGSGDLNKQAPKPAPQSGGTLPSPVTAPAAKPNSMRFYQDPKTGNYIQIPNGYTVIDGHIQKEGSTAQAGMVYPGGNPDFDESGKQNDGKTLFAASGARAGQTGGGHGQIDKTTGQLIGGGATAPDKSAQPGLKIYSREDVAGLAIQPTDAQLASKTWQMQKNLADSIAAMHAGDPDGLRTALKANRWAEPFLRKKGNGFHADVKIGKTTPTPAANPTVSITTTAPETTPTADEAATGTAQEASPHWTVPGPTDPTIKKLDTPEKRHAAALANLKPLAEKAAKKTAKNYLG